MVTSETTTIKTNQSMRREGKRFNVRSNQTIKKCPLCTRWLGRTVDEINLQDRYNADKEFRKAVHRCPSDHVNITQVTSYSKIYTEKTQEQIEDDSDSDFDVAENKNTRKKASQKQVEEQVDEEDQKGELREISKQLNSMNFKRFTSGFIARDVGYSRSSHNKPEKTLDVEKRFYSRSNKHRNEHVENAMLC